LNWKRFQFNFPLYAVMMFIAIVPKLWIRGVLHFNSYDLIYRAVLAMSASLAIIGLAELNRGGRRKVRYILTGCYFIFFCFSLALFIIKPNGDLAIGFPFFASLIVNASPFPLALYLKRRQNRPKLPSEVVRGILAK